MKLDDLKYGKDNGSREEKAVEKVVETKPTPSISKTTRLPSIALSSDYTKPEGEIEVRILFILSGGEDRERNYFKMLKDDNHLERIKVAFTSKEGQGLNPTQLLEAAENCVGSKKFTTKESIYRFEKDNGDIIYLLQDIDQFEKEIRTLTVDEQPDCLRWIYSNPAFEMWLYYHYFKDPLPNLKDAIGRTIAERSKWLKEYLPEIIKGGVKTTKAINQIRMAIDNSKANYKEDSGLPSLFSTQMHVLAEDILDTMGDEFDKMLERKAAFNKAMMEKFRKPIVKSIRYDGEKIRSLIDAFSTWADSHPLRLPHIEIVEATGSWYFDNRAFPLSYKLKKAYFDDDSGESMPVNTDELYMVNIQNEIYHFYHILFIQNSPIATYTIDYSEIKDMIDLLGLDRNYAILSSFHLDIFDKLYGGESLYETEWGYIYKDVEIHQIQARGRFMIIMRKEYLPKADFKPYEGDNSEFEQIDDRNFINSNIHQMKDLGDFYGLSVMRVVRFQLPQKGCFRFIKLNIVDYAKDKSELNKMSKVDAVNLQYQEGDFVMYMDKVQQILGISKDGGIRLSEAEEMVGINEIAPVRIDGVQDANIYYDPIVAASFIAPSETPPVHHTDYSYYLEHFKRNTLEGKEKTLYDLCMSQKFRYVHEIQHWLRDMYGWDRLMINH